MPSNDPVPVPAPEPHGQAALILVESLIHQLIEKSILTPGDAIDIVGSAIDVQTDIVADEEARSAEMAQAHLLLSSILRSLTTATIA